MVAHEWLTRVFEPVVLAIPWDLRAKLEPAEVFHQVLEHRCYMSQARGRAVPLAEVLSKQAIFLAKLLAEYAGHADKPPAAGDVGRDSDRAGLLVVNHLGRAALGRKSPGCNGRGAEGRRHRFLRSGVAVAVS